MQKANNKLEVFYIFEKGVISFVYKDLIFFKIPIKSEQINQDFIKYEIQISI